MRSVFRGTRMDPGGAISVLTDAPAPEAHVTITICAPAKVRPADTAVDGNLVAPEPGSHKTHRWSKADSNSESHPRATPPAATRFVADSALEGAGFELLVPRHESPRFP